MSFVVLFNIFAGIFCAGMAYVSYINRSVEWFYFQTMLAFLNFLFAIINWK